MNFLKQLESHLSLVPTIVAAVQAFQSIGHSKETTIQKIGDIIKVSAAVGEAVPIPIVAAVSGLVETIAGAVFAPATPAAGATA